MNKHFLVVISLLLSCHAFAAIYEIIDKDGNKTYTNTPPQGPTETPPKKIDTKETNVWRGGEKQLELNDAFYQNLIQQQAEADAKKTEKKRLWQEAYHRLESAKEALEEAKVIKVGDYYPNTHGGIRYKQVYKDRVKAAEDAVASAQEEFDTIDQNTPVKDKAKQEKSTEKE